jgi:hypothetical protein
MIVQRWKNRDVSLSRTARYLFIAFGVTLIAAFALVYLEPPHEVEVVSDFFHPESGSVIVSPLTALEKIALSIALLGFVALLLGVVVFLRSLYSRRSHATSVI